jgi:hypothetical protein
MLLILLWILISFLSIFQRPIFCDASEAWARHFDIQSETQEIYRRKQYFSMEKKDLSLEKQDICSPVINKMDGSWFIDKSPMRDFIHK